MSMGANTLTANNEEWGQKPLLVMFTISFLLKELTLNDKSNSPKAIKLHRTGSSSPGRETRATKREKIVTV